MLFKSLKLAVLLSAAFSSIYAQNPLYIPSTVTGTNIDLYVQTGNKVFYPGKTTPTYGINGDFLSPTIVVNKGDVVTLNVHNNLPEATTMHWHGLHVAPENDGGPHQSIGAGETWSPSFEILNNASTFWYHPHGEGKTDIHVAKGLAGLFIIHDDVEQALGLPITYGVDDFPIIVQSKAFDVLTQIATSTEMDTVIMVNGTIDAYLDVPSQVIRLRLLNGSSMRSFHFGLSGGLNFHQIGTDGGLKPAVAELSRITLAPGERTEILVDLNGKSGQNISLMSYASEMPNGIYGSPVVGMAPDTIIDYERNFLNGTDFRLVELRVGAQTANPVTALPTTLVPFVPFKLADADEFRTFVFDTISEFVGLVPNLAEGPFAINNDLFEMAKIDVEVALNATEVWTLVNKTHIAHPFHIHDIQFNILKKNGVAPVEAENGWKDVVLVMPHDSVKFITKFTTFANNEVPYMYHCHLLHHEDDGMMGTFLVKDPNAGIDNQVNEKQILVFPNPSTDGWNVDGTENLQFLGLYNSLGQKLTFNAVKQEHSYSISAEKLPAGLFVLHVRDEQGKEHYLRLEK